MISTLVAVLLENVTASDAPWLQNLLEHIFQNIILEEQPTILEISMQVWKEICSKVTLSSSLRLALPRWLHITMSPLSVQIPVQRLPIAGSSWERDMKVPTRKIDIYQFNMSAQDSAMVNQDFDVIDRGSMLLNRFSAMEMLVEAVNKSNADGYFLEQLAMYNPLTDGLLRWSMQGQLYCAALEMWSMAASDVQQQSNCYDACQNILDHLDSCTTPLGDQHDQFSRLRSECMALLQMLLTRGKLAASSLPPVREKGFQLSDAETIITSWVPTLVQSIALPSNEIAEFERSIQAQMQSIQLLINKIRESSGRFNEIVHTAAASALIHLGPIIRPGEKPKINPIVRSLMNGIKTEGFEWLQKRNAQSVAYLIEVLCHEPDTVDRGFCGKVVAKLTKNLCSFVCSDPSELPPHSDSADTHVILSMVRDTSEEGSVSQDVKLIVRGAMFALESICVKLGSTIFESVSTLWENTGQVLAHFDDADPQSLVNALHILKTISPLLHPDIWYQKILPLCPTVLNIVTSPVAVLRFAASRCLAELCKVYQKKRLHVGSQGSSPRQKNLPSAPVSPMLLIIRDGLARLGDTTNLNHRLGIAELIWHLLQQMDVEILPYLTFFLVPVLGRMSDHTEAVRHVITRCFSLIVRLMPLEVCFLLFGLLTAHIYRSYVVFVCPVCV